MKLRYRRALFLGAFFLFTAIAPVVILGASGYRYDFQERVLVPTGTLVLKSYPQGAKIRINDREAAKRTPAEIQGLPPSRYALEVTADHFRPWRKEVEIRGNRITVEDQILLIPKRIAVSSVLTEEIRTFAVSPDGRNLVYVRRGKSDDGESLWFFDLDENKERLLFPLTSKERGALSSDGSIDRLLWLMEGRGVAFSISTAASKRYFILALPKGERGEEAYEFSPPGSGEIAQWKWSKSGLNLFFIQVESLYRADYGKRSIERVIPDRVQEYALLGDFLYFVTISPPVLFKQNLVTQERTEIAALPIEPAEERLQGQLVLSAQGRIALIDRHRVLWLIEDVPSGAVAPVAGGVQAALFDAAGKQLLYQTKQGLVIYHIEEAGTLGAREAGSFETVLRKEAVVGPVWYSDQSHILYGAGNAVYITETGGQGPPNTYSLLRIPGETPKFVYHDRDRIYFLFRNRLYQADLSFAKPRSLLGSRS